MIGRTKNLDFVDSSRADLREFSRPVRVIIGVALAEAQRGLKHPDAKPLRGFKGAGVLEVVANFDGDTYRAVYTVRLVHAVYVLHCFQKKSTHGIATSARDMELIERRLRMAEAIDRAKGTAT
jgi:phage-related protein